MLCGGWLCRPHQCCIVIGPHHITTGHGDWLHQLLASLQVLYVPAEHSSASQVVKQRQKDAALLNMSAAGGLAEQLTDVIWNAGMLPNACTRNKTSGRLNMGCRMCVYTHSSLQVQL